MVEGTKFTSDLSSMEYESAHFHGVAENTPYVECRLPEKEQNEHLNPVFSLIYEGPAQVVLSRISGRRSVHADLPFYLVPLFLYEPSTVDDIPLELGKGIYIDLRVLFVGKAVMSTIIPTRFIAHFDPPAILPCADEDGSYRKIRTVPHLG
ncbi:Uncharacterized protein T310_2850 [Rasamsonia emersonii CBS 393.64]|uniref:Uncharacterized protein n=1 Tax=Rasamsonia emersonii (strain ATCC 16479 / CBS 393.64 / IMI 116815) TaxID=1408163 RepID=A0A0F4YY22_RASE3|nr:Uncharacterized protein T310_2850 [Rasamsonia emersonii CBS 393.64]KKA23124.1 Uncharacterized protein T310_2850 [Rasamsonia emersonii CBS 393.64]